MRSTYSKDQLFVTAAKKKPRWQAHIDNLNNLTEDDIEKLDEPMWVRQSLSILKQCDGLSQKERLQKIWNNAQKAADEELARAAEEYEIRLWTGGTDSFKGLTMDNRRSWEIEIVPGEPFMVRDNDVIIISGEFYRLSNSEMFKMVDNSKHFMEATIQGYFNYYKDTYLKNKH